MLESDQAKTEAMLKNVGEERMRFALLVFYLNTTQWAGGLVGFWMWLEMGIMTQPSVLRTSRRCIEYFWSKIIMPHAKIRLWTLSRQPLVESTSPSFYLTIRRSTSMDLNPFLHEFKWKLFRAMAEDALNAKTMNVKGKQIGDIFCSWCLQMGVSRTCRGTDFIALDPWKWPNTWSTRWRSNFFFEKLKSKSNIGVRWADGRSGQGLEDGHLREIWTWSCPRWNIFSQP